MYSKQANYGHSIPGNGAPQVKQVVEIPLGGAGNSTITTTMVRFNEAQFNTTKDTSRSIWEKVKSFFADLLS